jgi:endonuclease III
MTTIEDVIQRVRAEYVEMPGMRLKAEQVKRLFGIERKTCQIVLDALVDARFLCVKPDGHYARLADELLRVRPARAELRTDRRSPKAS